MWPWNRPNTPEVCHIYTNPRTVPLTLPLYFLNCGFAVWKSIFIRSSGAMSVFACSCQRICYARCTAQPAMPPAKVLRMKKLVETSFSRSNLAEGGALLERALTSWAPHGVEGVCNCCCVSAIYRRCGAIVGISQSVSMLGKVRAMWPIHRLYFRGHVSQG